MSKVNTTLLEKLVTNKPEDKWCFLYANSKVLTTILNTIGYRHQLFGNTHMAFNRFYKVNYELMVDYLDMYPEVFRRYRKMKSLFPDTLTYGVELLDLWDTCKEEVGLLTRQLIEEYQDNGYSDERMVEIWTLYSKKLKPLIEKYDQILDSVTRNSPQRRVSAVSETQRNKLNDVSYDDKGRVLVYKKMECVIPSDTAEEVICKNVFKLDPDQKISWDELYKELEGENPFKNPKKNRKKITDAISRVNKKVKEAFNTDDILISSSKGQIFRNF